MLPVRSHYDTTSLFRLFSVWKMKLPTITTIAATASLISSVSASSSSSSSSPDTTPDYNTCGLLPFDNPFLLGSEDVQEWKDGLFFVSAGYAYPTGLGFTGSVYGLKLDEEGKDTPKLEELPIVNLPPELYFRPHGLYIEGNRLFIISHNDNGDDVDDNNEENVVVFDIIEGEDDELPELVFVVAFKSEQWAGPYESALVPDLEFPLTGELTWFLNDIVVVDGDEFLVAQMGPTNFLNPVDPAGPVTVPKTLWSCKFDEELLEGSSSSAEGSAVAVSIGCESIDIPGNVGLNGIAVNDDKDTIWVNDQLNRRLVEINRNESGEYSVNNDGEILFGALIDNVQYVDGALVAGVINGVFPPECSPEEFRGGYLRIPEGTTDASLVYELDSTFLADVAAEAVPFVGAPVPFLVSSAVPFGNNLIFGSFTYAGVVVCSEV